MVVQEVVHIDLVEEDQEDGSINIFYTDSFTKGTITASGGAGGTGTKRGSDNTGGRGVSGGAGGNGTISCGALIYRAYLPAK